MSRFTARAKELLSTAKAGSPIARLDRSVEAETLWPANLEKEADKAASILRSFFYDGFIVPYRTLASCDQQIVRKCHGLAVFHLLRNGFHSPAASGSGVLITRLPDGKWSGPSAILIDNNASFPADVDVVDVVLVINDEHGTTALLDSVVALQKVLTVAPGPIPQSGVVQQHSNKAAPTTSRSAWSYVKSKGELVEMDLSSLVIREAGDENGRFYGIEGVTGREILSGHAKAPSGVSDQLSNTIRTLDLHSEDLGGLPKPGKCPGDRRVRTAGEV